MAKRLIFPLGLLASVLVFSACAGGNLAELQSVNFYVDDGSLPPEFYSESFLSLEEVENRELKVFYERKFPHRSEETLEEDFFAEAYIGGEYVDRYENIIGMVEGGGFDEFMADETCTGGSNLAVELDYMDDALDKREDFYLCGDVEDDLLELQTFFSDVVDMMSVEEKV